MEKYMLKDFARWARRIGFSKIELLSVLDEMEEGLLGDRLGSNIYKKRARLAGRGKRCGSRLILIFKPGELAVFLYGYAKNEKSDLDPREEESLRIFAKEFLMLPESNRAESVRRGTLIEFEGGENGA